LVFQWILGVRLPTKKISRLPKLFWETRKPSPNLRENLKDKPALIRNSGAVLSSKTPIGYIDIRVFAHATENVDKVLNAVRNILPSELIDQVAFKKANLTGHHGNPIILYETRIKERDAVQKIFEKLSSGLSALDKELLNNEIVQHLENGNLYIRLDKQSAYLKEFKVSQGDPIHFRIHFKKHSQEEVVEICRKFGLLP